MPTLNLDEMFPKYDSPKYVNYVKKEYEDLINGIKHDSHSLRLSDLYYVCTKERKLKKFPFFIYWLFADTNNLWTRENIKNLIDGYISLVDYDRKEGWNKVTKILDKIYDEDPNSIFHFPEFDPIKIKHRYQKQKKAVIERTMLETIKNSSYFSQIAKNISKIITEELNRSITQQLKKLAEYFELEDEILQYIKSEGVVIKSEMRRNKRRFQKIDKDLFEAILDRLEKEEKISIKIMSNRKYLIYKK